MFNKWVGKLGREVDQISYNSSSSFKNKIIRKGNFLSIYVSSPGILASITLLLQGMNDNSSVY